MASDLSKQERAIKALKELAEVVRSWALGKTTHLSSMERVEDIVKKAQV